MTESQRSSRKALALAFGSAIVLAAGTVAYLSVSSMSDPTHVGMLRTHEDHGRRLAFHGWGVDQVPEFEAMESMRKKEKKDKKGKGKSTMKAEEHVPEYEAMESMRKKEKKDKKGKGKSAMEALAMPGEMQYRSEMEAQDMPAEFKRSSKSSKTSAELKGMRDVVGAAAGGK
ncbi:hypothetical protein Poli38472_002008 [Pythium oligandrum]|uniref:Uncharacterized protein n=1 Tax=Pythium oligandrum TaxID=41045 RepID=A0A8K1CVU4_PYTOL|nr:hypothetical protein Poli38472_002008 [Pythium oligandrum]|eukprot:TMW69852.1 hypothetical protein Poli38472_002008 [Pythium oligandrum]